MDNKKQKIPYVRTKKEKPIGYILGKNDNTSIVCLPFENSQEYNALVLGNSNYDIFLPNIAKNIIAGNSQIIIDANGKYKAALKKIAEKYKYSTYTLNATEEEIVESTGWNCLENIKESADPEKEASLISEFIINKYMTGESYSWKLTNINTLKLILLYVACSEGFISPYETELGLRTFDDVQYCINLASKKLISFIESTIMTSKDDEILLSASLLTFTLNDRKEEILINLGNIITNFCNTVSRKLVSDTSGGRLNLNVLKTEKVIVYIQTEPKTESLYSTQVMMFLDVALRSSMETVGNEHSKYINFTITDFSYISDIPNLVDTIKYSTEYGVQLNIGALSIAQMEHYYSGRIGNDRYSWYDIVESIPLKVYFGGSPYKIAEYDKYYSNKNNALRKAENTEYEHKEDRYIPLKQEECLVWFRSFNAILLEKI